MSKRFQLDGLMASVSASTRKANAQPLPKIGAGVAKVRKAGEPVRFTIHGEPMGKPRMTQRDKWAKRPVVLRYRAFADHARASAPIDLPPFPESVSWTAYLPLPDSWSQKKKGAHAGRLHQSKPDRDNIDKAILDALWESDSCIAHGVVEKRWDDGKGPRIELTVY
jgi:Holliday junction resolvase RusA-like endonuclease